MDSPADQDAVRKLNNAHHAYIDAHLLDVYIEDAVALLAEQRPPRPLEFLKIYFESVRDGTNVLRRDYRYVSSTPRNKRAFASRVREMLAGHGPLPACEYHQLIELICPDFPLDVVKSAHSAVASLRAAAFGAAREEARGTDGKVATGCLPRPGGMLGSDATAGGGVGPCRGQAGGSAFVDPESFCYAFAVCLFYADFFAASEEALGVAIRAFLSGPGLAGSGPQDAVACLGQRYFDAVVGLHSRKREQSFWRVDKPPEAVLRAAARSAFQAFVSAEDHPDPAAPQPGTAAARAATTSPADAAGTRGPSQAVELPGSEHAPGAAVSDTRLREMVRAAHGRVVIEIAESDDVRELIDCA